MDGWTDIYIYACMYILDQTGILVIFLLVVVIFKCDSINIFVVLLYLRGFAHVLM